MAAPVVEISHQNHNSLLFETLHDFAINEKFTDICFVCAKNKKIYTHKLLLCSVSDEMKQIILDIPETNDMITIHIPDVRKATVSLVVRFLYNGSMKLSQEQYKDFQDTMKLLGIVLTVNVGNDQTAQQPAPAPPPVQEEVPQLTVYQSAGPTLIQNPTMPIPSQPQPESQFIYVRSEQNSTQGMQYVIPEQTQYANITQTGNGMIPVQEAIQAVPVNPHQMIPVVQSRVPPRSNVQARNQSVASSQVVARNNNVVAVPNQVPRQQIMAPNTGQYPVTQRNNQVIQSQQNNVQFGTGPGRGRGSTYTMTNQQALQNNSNQLQNLLTQPRIMVPTVVRPQGQLRRRRRQLQLQQQQQQLMQQPQQLQVDEGTRAKRTRNST